MTTRLRTMGLGWALAWSSLAALPAAAQPALNTVTLNPNGGMTAGDGLRIALSYVGGANATSFLQVYRGGSGQIHDPQEVTGVSRAHLGIGPTASGVTVGTDEPWGSQGASLSAVSGTGSAADPWRATLTLLTQAGGDAPGFALAQTFSYVAGEDTVLLALTVTPPANNTQPVKLYHQTDTSLDASEEGPALVRPGTANPRVVGIERTASPEGFIGYLRVDPFAHFFAGDCCTAAGIGAAGDLADAINTDSDTDQMLAVQFSLGVITAPTTVRVRMGFRGAPCTAGSGTAAAPDLGCAAGSPACDADTLICVPCTNVGFCGNAGACDDGLQRCRACVDDMSAAGTDSGCGAAAPICDTSGDAPACVPCVDDVNGVGQDSGCMLATPICADAECVACRDDATGDGIDSGCDAGEPLCDTSGAAPACVACTDSEEGAEDDGCSGSAPVCVAGICSQCEDSTNTAGAVDFGCAAASPVCDMSGAAPACATCLQDDDCATAVCNATRHACEACRDDESSTTDAGCSAAAPHCDVSGAPVCAACVDDQSGGDADLGCGDDKPLCQVGAGPAHCVACADDQEPGMPDRGCPAQAPVCDTSGAEPRCIACIDDREDSGVDFGCDGERSFCDAGGDAPVCAYCLDTERSARDLGCTDVAPACVVLEGLHVCVECEDDQSSDTADFGCTDDAPFCDAESPLGGCLECVDDGDCDDGLRCNAGHQCAAGCSDDDQCSGELAACDEEQQTCALCTDDDDSACADALRGRACVTSRCGCLTDDDCNSKLVCAVDPGLCVPRSALSDPGPGAPSGPEPSEPEPTKPEATPTTPAPIVRLRGGSHCSTTLPGTPTPLPALSLLLLLRRRRQKGDGPA